MLQFFNLTQRFPFGEIAESSVVKLQLAQPHPAHLNLACPFVQVYPGKLVVALFAYEEVLFVHASWNRDVEKADHHFVIGLLAPVHFCIGIRIVRVCL